MMTNEQIQRQYAHHAPNKALMLTAIEEARLWGNTAVALGGDE